MEFDAVGFFDAALDFVDEAEDVFCGGGAGVDDKAGVLFRDLRAADGQAFEAGFLNQRACVVAGRALERAARARHFERLLCLAALSEVGNLGVPRLFHFWL